MHSGSRFTSLSLTLALLVGLAACGTSGGEPVQETSPVTGDTPVSTTVAPDVEGSSTTAASSSPPTRLEPDRVVRVATSEPADPPFSLIAGQQVEGFEPDLLELIGSEMAGVVEFEWVIVGRGEAFGGLGVTHDIYMDLMTNNLVRQENNAMTDPYLLAGWTALVPVDSPIAEFSELTSIAVPSGTTLSLIMAELINESGADIDLVVSDGVVGDSTGGGADGVAATSVTTLEGYRALTAPRYDLPISMALVDPDLRDEINEALATIISDGRWLTIYERWIGTPPFDPATMVDIEPTD